MNFGQLVCWMKRQLGSDHQFRRARKGEDTHLVHCKLCGHTRSIKHRKPVIVAPDLFRGEA